MARVSDQARVIYRQEMAAAKSADTVETRWRHLERAHIVSQPHAKLHTRNHAAMLALAPRQHDRREALGPRRVAAALRRSITVGAHRWLLLAGMTSGVGFTGGYATSVAFRGAGE